MLTGNVGGWHDDKHKLPMKNKINDDEHMLGGWHDDKYKLPMKK